MCEITGGNVTANNTWGPAGLLARHTNNPTTGASASTYYVWDGLGNTVQTLDGGGNLTNTLAYDAYGKRTATAATTDPYSGFGGQWGYYTEPETGLTLCGARYYDSFTGRWLTRDPIGYSGGINLYAYAGGNPLSNIDPLGLWATGSYLGDVGQVFAGYGDVLNPVNMLKGLGGLYQSIRCNGLGGALGGLAGGLGHTLTDWASTGDPRAFGRSFGGTLAIAGGAAAPYATGAEAAAAAEAAEAEAAGPMTTVIGKMADLEEFEGNPLIDTWARSGRKPGHGEPPVTWPENAKWLQDRIDRGDNFGIATDPDTLPPITNGYVPGQPNGYFTGREYQMLLDAGKEVKSMYWPYNITIE